MNVISFLKNLQIKPKIFSVAFKALHNSPNLPIETLLPLVSSTNHWFQFNWLLLRPLNLSCLASSQMLSWNAPPPSSPTFAHSQGAPVQEGFSDQLNPQNSSPTSELPKLSLSVTPADLCYRACGPDAVIYVHLSYCFSPYPDYKLLKDQGLYFLFLHIPHYTHRGSQHLLSTYSM